jgi:acyl carrier protein
MNEEAILERVKKVVEEKLVVDEEEIDLSSDFIEDLGADSLDIPDLVMAFEEEFDIEIPDEVVEKIKTVGDVVKIIKDKLG